MTPVQQRLAVLIGDVAGLVVLDVIIARMRHRARDADQPGPVARHPWLMAVAVEVAAELGDAIVYQRRRAAAAIDRAVAAQHLPASQASRVPAAGSAVPLPAPRATPETNVLPHSADTSEL